MHFLIQFRIRHRWFQRVLLDFMFLCWCSCITSIFYANQYLNIVITTSWSNHKKNSKIYYQWNHLWIFQLQQRSHPNGIRLLQHYGTWLVEKIDLKNNCLYVYICLCCVVCSPTTIYSIDISCLYEWLGELEFVGWF